MVSQSFSPALPELTWVTIVDAFGQERMLRLRTIDYGS
jgi:hypothetical protein